MYLHLSDFGFAKDTNPQNMSMSMKEISAPYMERINSSKSSYIKGTSAYLPPEIVNANFSEKDISKQDLWAVGVIAY